MSSYIPLTAVHPQGDFVLLYANEFVAFSEIFYSIYGSVNCSHQHSAHRIILAFVAFFLSRIIIFSRFLVSGCFAQFLLYSVENVFFCNFLTLTFIDVSQFFTLDSLYFLYPLQFVDSQTPIKKPKSNSIQMYFLWQNWRFFSLIFVTL